MLATKQSESWTRLTSATSNISAASSPSVSDSASSTWDQIPPEAVQPCHPEKGIRGTNSVIAISKTAIYDKILAPGQSPEDKICLQFLLACTLLHELAHAAQHHLFGGDAFEDFRETSIVSEAGFEYESRIFGQRPQFFLGHPNPNYRIAWGIWQSRGGLEGTYDTDKLARNAWQMPVNPQLWADGLDFVTKLFDDGFGKVRQVSMPCTALLL